MKSDRSDRLISYIERSKEFLTEKVEAESSYQELVETLNSYLERLKSDRLIIKIVSPSRVLAEKLQRKNQTNESLRSLYEFQVVSPISNLRQILQHCDLICLLYDSTHSIRDHHRKLNELAQQEQIALFLLLNQSKSQATNISYEDWLLSQDYPIPNWVRLPLDDFVDLDNQAQVELYQRSLIELSPTVANTRPSRTKQAVKREIKHFFTQQTTHAWREIKQSQSDYLANEQLFSYQQRFRQNIYDVNQSRQQLTREIKQGINYSKAELVNPFIADSLIFKIQQIIDLSEVKAIKETEDIYLYLTLNHFPNQPYLHDYILDFCQKETNKIIEEQWSKINNPSAYGGLKNMAENQSQAIAKFSALLDSDPDILELVIPTTPTLDLAEIIDPHCLKSNSRIKFDYTYAQSSWFRLLVSVLVGLSIYLVTWLFSGTGRYIGFIIIVFQIISLITGQDIKKSKLKQHTKELKRTVDQRYQSLVRIIVNHIAQTLIVAVDHESQQCQLQWSKAIATAQDKLNELQQKSDRGKNSIKRLKSDRDKIESWF